MRQERRRAVRGVRRKNNCGMRQAAGYAPGTSYQEPATRTILLAANRKPLFFKFTIFISSAKYKLLTS